MSVGYIFAKSSKQNTNDMKIRVQLGFEKITISEPNIKEKYYITQAADNLRFYVTSDNGYNGHGGDGYKNLEDAIRYVKKEVKNYFFDRCEPAPTKGFK